MADVDCCVCCGEPVPEGRQVCMTCEQPNTLTDEELLALNAVVYGCNTNRKLVYAKYMQGVHSENPQTIPFDKAIEIVQKLIIRLENGRRI